MSYYKIIEGKRYERSLLETAEKFQAENSGGFIDLAAIQALFHAAQDRRKITRTEERTLQYIADHFLLSQEAKDWFDSQALSRASFEQLLAQTIQERVGLAQLTWDISASEVQDQERKYGATEAFEDILSRGITALLQDHSQGILKMAHLVDYRFLDQKGPKWIPAAIRSFVNRGKIRLLPGDGREVASSFEWPLGKLTEGVKEKYWLFGWELPDLPLFRFVSFVPRKAGKAHVNIYFSKQAPTEERVSFVIQQMLGWDRYSWQIPGEEANRQELGYPQNQRTWEFALYTSLDQGIYNRESSLSFYDHLTEEIWPDPERNARSYIDQYLARGFRIFLLSEDAANSPETPGSPYFPLPPNFSLSLDSFWYFGVEFPGQTDIRVLINTARDGKGGDDSWNDAFIPGGGDFSSHIQRIFQEFKLEDIQWQVDPVEVALQHDTYDPWWRNTTSVIRQMVNTFLYDYVTEKSLFYVVSQVHQEDIAPSAFESSQAYRQAVSLQIHRYLKTGILHLIPSRIYQLAGDELEVLSPPPHGESLENYWIFQLLLPDLGDQAFYACIPRWPSFEDVDGRPYNYGT